MTAWNLEPHVIHDYYPQVKGAPMAAATMRIIPDLGLLAAALRAVARHATALADELDGIKAGDGGGSTPTTTPEEQS